MSFKRDGDDLSLLNRLKHQRVTDLLGNYIPEEEAKLLSNGRLTCLVCSHRPIFDTIKILAVHRKGKKHLLELSKYIKKKNELDYLAMKKEQQNSLSLTNEDDPGSKLCVMNANLMEHCLLGPKEKSSNKHNRKINDTLRRKTLEIPSFINECIKVNTKEDLETTHGPSAAMQVRDYLRQLPRKASLERMVEKKRDSYNNPSHEITSSSNETSETVKPDATVASLPLNPKTGSGSKELSIHMSGWIKDKFGDWMKDPNAEFDSDDDQPPETSP